MSGHFYRIVLDLFSSSSSISYSDYEDEEEDEEDSFAPG
jgi:hypothetical protein